jgi:hypothetical protein
MSERPTRVRDGDEREPAPGREPYTPPRLVRHGTIEDLTRGGAFTSVPTDPNSLG